MCVGKLFELSLRIITLTFSFSSDEPRLPEAAPHGLPLAHLLHHLHHVSIEVLHIRTLPKPLPQIPFSAA